MGRSSRSRQRAERTWLTLARSTGSSSRGEPGRRVFAITRGNHTVAPGWRPCVGRRPGALDPSSFAPMNPAKGREERQKILRYRELHQEVRMTMNPACGTQPRRAPHGGPAGPKPGVAPGSRRRRCSSLGPLSRPSIAPMNPAKGGRKRWKLLSNQELHHEARMTMNPAYGTHRVAGGVRPRAALGCPERLHRI
jgi:hypothetical protein